MSSLQRLDEVCDITMGQAPEGESYNTDGDGLPLIAGAGDFGEHQPISKKFTSNPGKVCAAGDIVLGIRASIGEKVVADRAYCLGRGVAGLRAKADLDSRYLWHWLSHTAPALIAKAKGATFKQVNREDIQELKINLPPLPEQRRVADILDKAGALRLKRRTALVQLNTLTQSIFLDMFGDPVANPKKWRAAKLAEVVDEMRYGPRFYNEAYADDGIRIARITDLNDAGELDFCSMPRMRVSDRDVEQFALKPGDIIFARTGATVGKVALFTAKDPPCIPGAYFIRIRFKEVVAPAYAQSVLTTMSIRRLIDMQSRQSAQQNFSGPGLKRLPIPVPSLALQKRFAQYLDAIQSQKRHQLRAATELEALHSTLQDQAFQGKL
jgi:type I restriction enzyme, S subunit